MLQALTSVTTRSVKSVKVLDMLSTLMCTQRKGLHRGERASPPLGRTMSKQRSVQVHEGHQHN
jgi:hypothetical protein